MSTATCSRMTSTTWRLQCTRLPALPQSSGSSHLPRTYRCNHVDGETATTTTAIGPVVVCVRTSSESYQALLSDLVRRWLDLGGRRLIHPRHAAWLLSVHPSRRQGRQCRRRPCDPGHRRQDPCRCGGSSA